jgi:hypothetical protein
MRNLLFAFIILLSCYCYALAQEQEEAEFNASFISQFKSDKNLYVFKDIEAKSFFTLNTKPVQNASDSAGEQELSKPLFQTTESETEPRAKEQNAEKSSISDVPDQEGSSLQKSDERFHWKPALIQSGVFLGLQHGFRMMQKKTRRELGGPFFRDWGESVKGLRGWNDSDNFFTNFIAHPLQGGLTGRIFINNSDRAKRQEFGKSKQYWETRLKALAWSAVWSTQFELGPLGEASLGNVGQYKRRGLNTMGWTDLVITPVLGTGVVILEDALDKFLLKNWLERKISGKFKIKALRIIFTPTTSVANLLRLRRPSSRDYR